MVKFDFLGLKTLTHINQALKIVAKNRGIKILEKDIKELYSDFEELKIISSSDSINYKNISFNEQFVKDTYINLKEALGDEFKLSEEEFLNRCLH